MVRIGGRCLSLIADAGARCTRARSFPFLFGAQDLKKKYGVSMDALAPAYGKEYVQHTRGG